MLDLRPEQNVSLEDDEDDIFNRLKRFYDGDCFAFFYLNRRKEKRMKSYFPK